MNDSQVATEEAEASVSQRDDTSQDTLSRDKSTFFVEWDPPKVGVVSKDGKKSNSKGDFAIELSMLVEAGSQTGYLASVKRAIDGEKRRCFFTVDSISYKYRFMAQLNNSFGSGGMSLAMSEAQFSLFFQFLKKDVANLPIAKATTHVGEQSDGVWVLNKATQINADGELIVEENQKYVWLEEAFIDKYANLSLSQLVPKVVTPLESNILSRLIEKMEIIMQHNFLPFLLMLGGMTVGFHYFSLQSGICPIMVAMGESQTGKSTMIRLLMSMIGLASDAIYEQFTNAFVLERSSASTLPFGIDDPASSPSKGRDLNEIIVELFNKGKSVSLRRENSPKSIPIVATNYKLKAEERVMSRVCVVPFSKPSIAATTDEQLDAFDEMDEMIDQNAPSRALGWIIQQKSLLHNKHQLRDMKKRLRGAFEGRSQMNWALVALTTTELLNDTGRPDLIDEVLDFLISIGTPSGSKAGIEDADVIRQTVRDILVLVEDMPLHEILQFMRTDVKVGGNMVLAVVLSDMSDALTYPVTTIRKAITTENRGEVFIVKDFLKPGESSTIITRNKTSRRRKCDGIYLNEVDDDQREQLLAATRSGNNAQIILQPNPSTSGGSPKQPLNPSTSGDKSVMPSDPSPRGSTPEQPTHPSDLDTSGEELVVLSGPSSNGGTPEQSIHPSDSSKSGNQLVIPSDPSPSGSTSESLIPEQPIHPSDLSKSGNQLVIPSGSSPRSSTPEHPIPEQPIHPSDSSTSGNELVIPSGPSLSGRTPECLIPEQPINPSDPPAHDPPPVKLDDPPPHKKRRTESQMLMDGLHEGIRASGSRLRKPKK